MTEEPIDSATFTLSEDQVEAIERIESWWLTDTEKQCFTLAGYAGTGKTTVISHLLRNFSSDVVVGTPTGKAALRLREKGVQADTIHRLAYHYKYLDEAGDPVFDFIGMGSKPPLVIVDEASMVNSVIYGDLLAEGYRMLFVGDNGQLPPVGGDPGIMRDPDFALSVIHRTDDAGLLDYAHDLRQGDFRPEPRGAVKHIALNPNRDVEMTTAAIADADVMICWKNATRHWLNWLALKREGHFDWSKELRTDHAFRYLDDLEGHVVRCVCLRNNYKRGVYNGQILNIEIGPRRGQSMIGKLFTDSGRTYPVDIDAKGFFLMERSYQPPPGHLLFDFGYCLTAHKSQGSEWPHVVVYDDTYRAMDDRPRWAYTAATRAEERLTWLHR